MSINSIEELRSLLRTASWFSHLGEPISINELEVEQISNMDAWNSVTGVLANDPIPDIINRGMMWLPTQRDIEDPVCGKSLEERSHQLGKKQEHSRECLETYKVALTSLRRFKGHSALKAGPHDFAEAARGAALYSARRATYEVLLDDCGFWCSLINIYADGHWPCGILPSGEIVVL